MPSYYPWPADPFIKKAYQENLGREPGEEEYGFWRSPSSSTEPLPGFEQQIRATPEGQAYRRKRLEESYQKYYGRGIRPDEDVAGWLSPVNPIDFDVRFPYFPEAQEYARRQAATQTTTGTGVPSGPGGGGGGSFGSAPIGFDPTKWANQAHQTEKYKVGRILAGGGSIQDAAKAVGATVLSADTIRMADGTTVDVLFDVEGIRRPQWLPNMPGGAGAPAGLAGGGPPLPGGGMPAPGQSGGPQARGWIDPSGGWSGGGPGPTGQTGVPGQSLQYGGTSVFDDPATREWERLLTQRVQQLGTPFQNPDFGPAVGQLRDYLGRLNRPPYSPSEMDLMQTQALDPMERQRSAAKQQIIERFASRGIPPSSGLVERALEQVDEQFNQLRTRTQAGFATHAIDLSRQQAAQAAQLAPAIAAFQQQQFGSQDIRNREAMELAGAIPQTAWSRLTGAEQGLERVNPLGIYQVMQNAQFLEQQQNQAFLEAIMKILGPLAQSRPKKTAQGVTHASADAESGND